MSTLNINTLVEELRTLDRQLRDLEQRYQLSSVVFFELYARGVLDDGTNIEELAEWVGCYRPGILARERGCKGTLKLR
jgi:hypothetical protein